MTYRTIRTIHLLLGLFFILFLLMYGVSSVQMAHPDWFDLQPETTELVLQVDAAAAADPGVLADHLRQAQGVRGSLRNVEKTDDGFTFRVVRPGTVHDVVYSRSSGSVQLRTHVAGIMGMLNRIHHIGGLQNDYPLLNVWGLFVALTSFGLIFLGITGVYMWFTSHRKRRRSGALLLGFSLTVSLLLMILIRTA